MTNEETEGADLSTTGVIAELSDTSTHERYGIIVDATAAADFEIRIKGGTVGPVTVESFSSTDSIQTRLAGPEVVDIQLVNTTTASGTADVIIGSGGR
jgi:hypothetical protein